MRSQILLAASVLCCLAPLPSRAQVSVDPRALDQLKPPPHETAQSPEPAAEPRNARRLAPPRTTRATPAAARPAPHANAEIYGPPRPPPPAPLAAAPPPLPVIPPPIEVPTRPIPPPPPVVVAPEAPGVAVPLKNGLRITFGPGSAALNKTTDAALRQLVFGLPPFDTVIYTLTSYASVDPDDPSTPRRLALARALAVRDVLIAEGVTSPRVIVKVAAATAVSTGEAPPDRVDIAMTPRPDGTVPGGTVPPGGGTRR
jgi:outer membrane protein OmpA-like peptidoglycan-associated protein